MKAITDKQKAQAFDLLISGKVNSIFDAYKYISQSGQNEYAPIIVRQACENALRLVLSKSV
jgi:hypothetical protein